MISHKVAQKRPTLTRAAKYRSRNVITPLCNILSIKSIIAYARNKFENADVNAQDTACKRFLGSPRVACEKNIEYHSGLLGLVATATATLKSV